MSKAVRQSLFEVRRKGIYHRDVKEPNQTPPENLPRHGVRIEITTKET